MSVYTYMHTHVHMHITLMYTHTHTHTHTHTQHTNTQRKRHTLIYVRTLLDLCFPTYPVMHAHITYAHICRRTRVITRVYVCTYVHSNSPYQGTVPYQPLSVTQTQT